MEGECENSSWRSICCPTKALPRNCEWVGAPERSVFGCTRGCGRSQFELNLDTYLDAKGRGNCYSRARSLCYDSTEILQKCHWSNCCWVSTEMVPDKDLCGDNEVATTRRYNNGQGSPCGLEQGPNSYRQPSQAFCCPKNDKFEKCVWRRDELGCKPAQCAKDKLQITSALLPSWKKEDYKVISRECIGTPGYPIPPMRMPQYPLCCEPPSRYGKKGPVEPSYLWSHCYDSKDDDVTWEFSDNFGNNNKDTMPGVMEDDPGTDP